MEMILDFVDPVVEAMLIRGIGRTKVGGRATAKYGEVITYPASYRGKEYPKWLMGVIPEVEVMLKRGVKSVGLSGYGVGGVIGPHVDNKKCGEVFGILSLGGPAILRFKKIAEANNFVDVDMVPRSLLIVEGEHRWDWTHEILPVRADRWSIAFRT